MFLWLFGLTTTVLCTCIGDDCDKLVEIQPRKPSPREPSTKGAFCCDNYNGHNMVPNGNFEFGNSQFDSDYQINSDTNPGQYVVSSSASQFAANVVDHSYCSSSIGYPSNSRFLLVNGLTNMPTGSTSVIWEQTIRLKKGSDYRFCGNFKNLPQCTFDTFPKVTVQLSSGVSRTVTINTDASNVCDWQKISFCFRAAQTSVTIKILLKEDSLGDGNDLAIDDISVQKLGDPNLATTMMHQYGTQVVTASINTIGLSDDYLPFDPSECNNLFSWFWYVVSLIDGHYDPAGSWGIGNSVIGSWMSNPVTTGFTTGPGWGLTTNFPGFTFEWGKQYAFGMVTQSCCTECVDSGWTVHHVYVSRRRKSYEKINSKSEILSLPSKTFSKPKSESEYSKSGLEITSSKSGQKDGHRLVNEKDIEKLMELVETFKSTKRYKELYQKYKGGYNKAYEELRK